MAGWLAGADVAGRLGREVGDYTHFISSVCHDRSVGQIVSQALRHSMILDDSFIDSLTHFTLWIHSFSIGSSVCLSVCLQSSDLQVCDAVLKAETKKPIVE